MLFRERPGSRSPRSLRPPCGSGPQPAPEGPVGLVTLIPSFGRAAAAGLVTHTHTHTRTPEDPSSARGRGLWGVQGRRGPLLPAHPPLATNLPIPMLKTSQVPDMDDRDPAQLLLSLSLTRLRAIHLGEAGLGLFPHFQGKLGNPNESQLPLLKSAVLGSQLPALLRERNEIIIVPHLACGNRDRRSLQAIYWISAATEIKGECLSRVRVDPHPDATQNFTMVASVYAVTLHSARL